MTGATDSHSLTNHVVENNGVSTHSFSAARFVQPELRQPVLLLCPSDYELRPTEWATMKALTKTGRQSLFIHIYTFWFCRTCCCVSIWLTALTIRWSTVYLLSGPLQKRTWQLFSFPQEAGNCSVICCVGELRAGIDPQCKNTIWVHWQLTFEVKKVA